MFLLFQGGIVRFHVSFRGCNLTMFFLDISRIFDSKISFDLLLPGSMWTCVKSRYSSPKAPHVSRMFPRVKWFLGGLCKRFPQVVFQVPMMCLMKAILVSLEGYIPKHIPLEHHGFQHSTSPPVFTRRRRCKLSCSNSSNFWKVGPDMLSADAAGGSKTQVF